MKSNFFVAVIFLISFPVCSQDIADSFQLTNIPVNGILLNKGWKFHAGDNPEWAKPEFDDQHWQLINPTLKLHHLRQVKESGIGWFRLKLQVDPSLTDKTLAMVTTSIGASEMYLNGKLIYRLGTVSKDYKVERTRFLYALPISLKLGHEPTQLLAVRYSYNKKNLYLNFIANPSCLQIVLKEVNQTFTDNTKGEGFLSILRSIQLSFYLPLGILILFLYYSFPNRREYLYLGVFCLSMFAGILLHIVSLLPSLTASKGMFFSLAEISIDIIGFLCLINGTRILYKLHKNWIFKVIIVYALLIIPSFFISNDWGGLFFLFFVLLIVVEFLRLNLQAVRHHIPLAWILFITASLLILVYIYMFWLFVIGNIYLFWVIFSIDYIIPAIGLSLFIAGDFARTRLALHLRVLEVEQLSAKTISQEKEKQQILRIREQQKSKHETELLELEAKALRAQMNPHFIFNCMNSIKSLIQQDEKDKAVTYFTTFSKLIRTIFQNSDKREITLFDEVETCRLYTQLECMRVGNKLSYSFSVDETIDLKSIRVPALILQPFIENAIWHGIIPKEDGGTLNVSISKKEDKIWCVVDDDGIGREISMQNKFKAASITHQSKGVRLTQSRLVLDNSLNERNASVEIIDKKKDYGSSEGTKVILILNEY